MNHWCCCELVDVTGEWCWRGLVMFPCVQAKRRQIEAQFPCHLNRRSVTSSLWFWPRIIAVMKANSSDLLSADDIISQGCRKPVNEAESGVIFWALKRITSTIGCRCVSEFHDGKAACYKSGSRSARNARRARAERHLLCTSALWVE